MASYQTRARLSFLGACLVATAACGLTDAGSPSTAHWKVTSSAPIRVITSTNFTFDGAGTNLLKADTVDTTAKEIDVALPSPARFFIRAMALTPGTTVTLVVDVGTRNWYDATRTLEPPETLEFLYGYSGPGF